MNRVIAICYVGWTFDFYDLVLFSYLLGPIGRAFGLTASQEGWLLGAALGASGLGGIFFGWLADRYGRKPLMTWTILIFSLGTGLSALAPSFWPFFVMRLVTGFGIGGEWAIGHALVAESTARGAGRGRAAAFLQSGEPVGVALAALVGFGFAPWLEARVGVNAWRWVFALSSFTGLWAWVARRHLPESALWRKASGAGPARAWLRSPAGAWVFIRALVLALFKLGTYWTCYIWLPRFLLTRFHQPIGRSMLWILTAQAAQFAGMLVFGRFSDRHGRREAYTVYSLLTAGALAALAFGGLALLARPLLFWAAMGALGFGSGCTAGFGALLSELFPTEVRNFSMGAAYNLARGAQFFAPPLVAWFALKYDLAGALGVPLALALATAAWVWTLPETRARDLARVLK